MAQVAGRGIVAVGGVGIELGELVSLRKKEISWGRGRWEAYEVDEVAGISCYVGRVVEVLDGELKREIGLFMVLFFKAV